MPEAVICNTSVLFYLHRLSCLELLKQLYEIVIVPEVVVHELEQGRIAGEDVPDVANYPWIQIRPTHIPEVLRLITDLGPGEAGVLALALEEQDATVILDDLLARRLAELKGLKITGTLGVLLKAKQKGYIKAIAPFLNRLLELDFRLSESLQKEILKLAGEI